MMLSLTGQIDRSDLCTKKEIRSTTHGFNLLLVYFTVNPLGMQGLFFAFAYQGRVTDNVGEHDRSELYNGFNHYTAI